MNIFFFKLNIQQLEYIRCHCLSAFFESASVFFPSFVFKAFFSINFIDHFKELVTVVGNFSPRNSEHYIILTCSFMVFQYQGEMCENDKYFKLFSSKAIFAVYMY